MTKANEATKRDNSTYFCGIRLNSPVILASGYFHETLSRERLAQFGAVCLRGTTLKKRRGNPAPNFRPIADAEATYPTLINSVGLKNSGPMLSLNYCHFNRTLDHLEDKNYPKYIANIVGFSPEEYATLTKMYDDTPVIAIEVNISCPNVGLFDEVEYPHGDRAREIISACRPHTKKPLIAKLTPNQTDIHETARICIDQGVNAISAVNTFNAMEIDVEKQTSVLGTFTGGLSGASIRPLALYQVYQVYQATREHNIPIIGQGGITCAHHAKQFVLAGANLVGVHSVMYHDDSESRVTELINDFSKWYKLHKSNLPRLKDPGSIYDRH